MAVQQKCATCGTWLPEKARRCRSCGKGTQAKGLVVWRPDVTDGRGKRVRRPQGTWELARRVALQVMDTQYTGERYGAQPERAVLGTLAAEYLADAQVAKYKDLRVRANAINLIVRTLGKDRTLASLSVADIHRYQQDRLAAGVTGSPVNRECRYLQVMLDWHEGLGRITANPIKGWRQLAENAPRTRIAAPNEVEAIVGYSPPPFDALTAILAAFPFRPAEAIALEWSWIDTSRPRWTITIPEGVSKSGRKRRIPIYYEEIQDQLAALPSRFKQGRVFLLEDGKPFNYRRYTVEFKKALLATGIRDLVPYDFRRTAITNLLMWGVTPHDVAYNSDHKSATIQQRYAQVQEEHQGELRDRWYNPATGRIEKVAQTQREVR